MKEGSMLSSFIARLRDDRRLEILVYSLLVLTAAIIFFATGGISCNGSGAKETAAPTEAAPDESRVLEKRLERILSSIEGAGEVRVMAVYEGGGASGAAGVIVVAEGAADIGVRIRLQNAVTTVLGIDPESVGVFTLE